MSDDIEDLLLRRKLIEPEQLQEALRLRAKFAADGIELSLEEVLLKKGWITPEQAQTLDPGREGRIPGFDILSTLGRGGMGVVYKARQTSMDRIVALKVLLPEYSREKGFIDRFLREARAVARLNHPHIVAGYDAGSAAGIHYTVMEFVEGETLDARLAREKKLPWKESLRIVRQIAQALDHAQSAGLIHRDIKPSNIMLAADGTAKLLDLGMARATGEGEASLTLTGHVVGTPKYMSPEQASGDKSIDIRADLYSLGITLYEMLSGAAPFTGSNPMAILHKHVHEGVRFAIPGIPAGVLSLGHRLTERNRLKRCASPAQLIAELDRLGDGVEPPRPVTRRIPVVRRSSRSGLWIALGGAAGLLLLAAVALPSRPSRPVPVKAPPRTEPLAVVPPTPEPAPKPEPKPEPPKPVEPVLPKPLPAPVPKPLPPAEPESKPRPKPEPAPAPAPAPEPAPKAEDRDPALLEAFAAELLARAGRRDYLRIDAAPPPVASIEGRRRLEEQLEAARLAREVWAGARDWIRGLRGKPALFETRQGRKVSGMVEAVANDDQMYVKEQVYATADLAPASLAAFYGMARGKAAKPEAVAALAAYEGDLALAEETLKKARATAPPGVEALLAGLRVRKAEAAARARDLKEAEALLKAGRLEELVQLYPSSPAAAAARERLAAKKASERKVVARWAFAAGAEGWDGTPVAGALQGLPSNDVYNLSACGLSGGAFPAWNPRHRLRFDYRLNAPVSLKIQIHPERSAITGTVWAQLDRAETGAWRTFDRRLGEFTSDKEPAPGDRINNLYIMAGFSDRTPELQIDNVEVYDPGEGKK